MLFDCLPSTYTLKKRSFLFPIEEFLLTLMRLRLALPIFDLACRFSISTASCSRIINYWIDVMYNEFSFMTYWPTREEVNSVMPIDFKTKYPNTRVVIDCTELYTQTPEKLSDRSRMYSS